MLTVQAADLPKAKLKRVSSRPGLAEGGLAEGGLAEGALPAPALGGLGSARPGFEPAVAYLALDLPLEDPLDHGVFYLGVGLHGPLCLLR